MTTRAHTGGSSLGDRPISSIRWKIRAAVAVGIAVQALAVFWFDSDAARAATDPDARALPSAAPATTNIPAGTETGDGLSEQIFDETVQAANAVPASGASPAGHDVALPGGDDPIGRALRDRLLIRRGYRELATLNLGEARNAFARVTTPGAATNAALLGIGWSYVFPAVSDPKRRRQAAAIVAKRLGLFDTFRSVATGPRLVALRHSLIPWQELIGRNPVDPAVQEGMVAIPYVLDHIGASDDALDYRVRTIAMLERIDAALKRSETDGSIDRIVACAARGDVGGDPWFAPLPEAKWWLREDGVPPDAFYWRDVLDDPSTMLAVVALQSGDVGARTRLENALSAQIRALDDSTQIYLAEARYALAREYQPERGGSR
ncbi:hypothetical protein DIE11_04805 [Burkholderia sp. Bp9012]|uniref:hypothetical protein n=1 Tax=Burkholderia sp. Bp9012 TaxID=2184562 RepID=UPI000F5B3CDD|nr:hypothetical protein [Burkholderia sp. Bp9012]RQR85342.1 hypothetical protein DIE11_04805 [Burkholderia sp. Bp9012]